MRYFWISKTHSGHIHADSAEEAKRQCPPETIELYSETSLVKNTVFIPIKLDKCGR